MVRHSGSMLARALRGVSWLTCGVRLARAQLFYSFFKTLVGKEIVVELKNGARTSLPNPSLRCMVASCSKRAAVVRRRRGHPWDAALR